MQFSGILSFTKTVSEKNANILKNNTEDIQQRITTSIKLLNYICRTPMNAI